MTNQEWYDLGIATNTFRNNFDNSISDLKYIVWPSKTDKREDEYWNQYSGMLDCIRESDLNDVSKIYAYLLSIGYNSILAAGILYKYTSNNGQEPLGKDIINTIRLFRKFVADTSFSYWQYTLYEELIWKLYFRNLIKLDKDKLRVVNLAYIWSRFLDKTEQNGPVTMYELVRFNKLTTNVFDVIVKYNAISSKGQRELHRNFYFRIEPSMGIWDTAPTEKMIYNYSRMKLIHGLPEMSCIKRDEIDDLGRKMGVGSSSMASKINNMRMSFESTKNPGFSFDHTERKELSFWYPEYVICGEDGCISVDKLNCGDLADAKTKIKEIKNVIAENQNAIIMVNPDYYDDPELWDMSDDEYMNCIIDISQEEE